jgi:hypothetical protein
MVISSGLFAGFMLTVTGNRKPVTDDWQLFPIFIR